MKNHDIDILTRMKESINSYKEIDLLKVSNELIYLFDFLGFKDEDWYKKVTDELANLDSTATYVCKNKIEEKCVNKIICNSLNSIKKLIDNKL